MNPYEYMNFKKDDFESNCIKDNGFTKSQAEDFFEIICAYIERFKEVRSSGSRTEEIINELIRKSETQIWIDNNWESNKYSFIMGWITKAVWQDRSYYWAKTYLGMHHNRKTGMAHYNVTEERISDPELYEILKAEESLNKTSTSINKAVDHSKLLVALNNYITGITPIEFTNIIERHNFSPGTAKALWVGKKKVDAWRFCKQLNMTNEEWNNLFRFPDETKLHGKHKDKLDKDSPINEILRTHLNK